MKLATCLCILAAAALFVAAPAQATGHTCPGKYACEDFGTCLKATTVPECGWKAGDEITVTICYAPSQDAVDGGTCKNTLSGTEDADTVSWLCSTDLCRRHRLDEDPANDDTKSCQEKNPFNGEGVNDQNCLTYKVKATDADVENGLSFDVIGHDGQFANDAPPFSNAGVNGYSCGGGCGEDRRGKGCSKCCRTAVIVPNQDCVQNACTQEECCTYYPGLTCQLP